MAEHEHTRQAPVVRGAGGKAGGGGGEAPDTVRSTQIADIVDLLSEGEVEGLTNGLKSIYLDGVPLQNPDDSFNFSRVNVAFTPGTQGQPAITGGDGVQNEVAVAVAVLQATPVVRTVTNPAVDRARVTISVPQLTETDTGSGQIRGSGFEWSIEVQSAGGGFVEVMRETIFQKVTSRYTRSKSFALTGPAPWDIRLKRLTPDSGSSFVVNQFSWSSYTEIQSLKLRHPNSAMARLRVNAQVFSRVPVRTYDLMGIRVQVPVNYDTIARTYAGVWNGTFKTAWTDDPAWIFHAVATNPRYGLGRYVQTTETLKWQLYAISQYCSGMVPDGKGGMEPRFRCGLELRDRRQAFEVLAQLAAIFRGMAFWSNDSVSVVQDAPADPAVLYTAANVVGGRFTYSTASRAKRPTQVTVWWNDINQGNKAVPELVINKAAEKRFGIKAMPDLAPLGLRSRGQARRVGLWALYSEEFEGETVTFQVGLDGVLVAPGTVVEIADPNEQGERLGGRVRSATTSLVTLDKPVTLAAGETYTLSVMLPDPDDSTRLVVHKRTVTTPAGTAGLLSVSPAYPAAPAAQTVWLLQSDAVQATTWRVLQVSEADGEDEQGQFTLTALRHYPQKFALIEQGIAFEPPTVSRIKLTPPAIDLVLLTPSVYLVGTEARNAVLVSWEEPAQGLQFLASWRVAGGEWVDLPPSSLNTFGLDALPAGLLEVQVRTRNALGNLSPATVASTTLTAPMPPSVRVRVSAQAFTFDAAGAAKPTAQTITITAELASLQGAASWTATRYNAAGASLGALTLGGSGNSRTATVAAFGAAAYAVMQATVGAYSDQVTLVRLQDGLAGAAAVSGFLTNEAHAVATAADGSGGSYASAGGTFKVFNGTADVTTSAAFSVVSSSGVTGAAINAATGVYSLTGTTSDIGTVTLRAVFGGVTIDRVYSISRSRAGTAGAPGAPGADGAPGANAQLLALLATAQSFTFDTANAAAPAVQTITFSAVLANLSGTATFTCTLFDAAGASLGTVVMGGSGNTRTLTVAQFGAASYATVLASLSGFSDQMRVVRLRDGVAGQNAVSGYLTNEAHTVATAANGSGGSYAGAGGTFKVFNGTADVTTSTAFSVVSSSGISGLSIGAGTGVFALTGMTADVGTATLRAVFAGVTIDRVYSIGKSKAGVPGADGAPGSPGANAQLLALLPTAQAFTFGPTNVAAPAGQTISFTALLANLSGTAVFTATRYDAAGTSLGTVVMGGAGNTRTLTDAQFGAAAYAVVQAALSGFSDQVRVVRLRDGATGAAAVSGYLTNEAHTVATAADGSGGSYGSAGGMFKVFNGTTDVSASSAFSVVSSSGITGLVINAATGVYTLSGTTADSGSAVLRAVYAGVTIDRAYSISRSKAGIPGADGADGANAQLLALMPTAQAFTFGTTGAAQPTSQTISFTALLANLAGTAAFTCTRYDAAGATLSSVTMGGSGNTRTLTVAQFADAAYAVVQASLGGFSDQVRIVRLRDGATGQNAVTGLLTNEAHTVATAADGSGGSYGSAGGTFKVFNGTTDVTTSSAFSVLSSSGISGLAINATTGVYTLSGTTADSGSAVLRAVYAGVTIDRTYSISRSKAGVPGADGPPGADGANAQLLALMPTAQAFTFGTTGAAQPTSQTISFTALLANLAGTAAFTCTRYDAAGATLSSVTMGGSGNTRTLTVAQFADAAYAVVQASLGGFSDQVRIVRLRDGATGQNAVTGLLTNEAHTVATAADGSGGSYGSAGGTFKVFNGTVDVTTSAAFSVLSSSGISGLAINATTGVYSLTGTTADTGTAVLRAMFGGVTIDRTYSISRSKTGAAGSDGAPGAPGVSVYLATIWRSSSSALTAPTGGTFNFASGVLTPPAGWSASALSPVVGELLQQATFNFSGAAGSTVTAGAWTTPTFLSPAGVVDPGPTVNHFAPRVGGTATAGIKFKPDGNIARRVSSSSSSTVDIAKIYLPLGGTPMASKYIRFTTVSFDVLTGSPSVGGVSGALLQVNVDREVTLAAPVTSSAELVVRYQIYADSGGTTLESTGLINLTAQAEP